jgi:glutathione S-transferase
MRERLEVFERLLAGRDYLYGEFGAADCFAYPFLKYAAGRDPADDETFHRVLADHQPLGDDHPRLADWIVRVGERPRAY